MTMFCKVFFTCLAGSFGLQVRVSRVLVHTHQAFVTLAQVVPRPSTGLPLHPGADGAAAAHTGGDPTLTLELQRPPRGAVDLLARWAVESPEAPGRPGGPLFCPQHP